MMVPLSVVSSCGAQCSAVWCLRLAIAAPALAAVLALLAWIWLALVHTARRRRGAAEAEHRTDRWLELAIGYATRVLATISAISSLGLMYYYQRPIGPEPVLFAWIHVDALSTYFILLVNVVAFFASWYTLDVATAPAGVPDEPPRSPNDDGEPGRADPQAKSAARGTDAPAGGVRASRRRSWLESGVLFHALFNAFHLTMLLVLIVDDLILLWLALELTTLASTLLICHRRSRRSIEASWKYIVLSTTGIVFAFLGTILLAYAVPGQFAHGDFMRWSLLAHLPPPHHLEHDLTQLSFLFVLIGFGTKAGLAPLHTWLPDSHGEAPSPVSALLSGVLLKCSLYALLRWTVITNTVETNRLFTSSAFLAMGLLSLVLAVPFILKGNEFKRVLAYHSLEHMGIIAFGIGIGTPLALFGALLHTLNHALTKALMFLSYENVRRTRESLQAKLISPGVWRRDDSVHLMRSMPVTRTLLLLGGVALVGSPPFNVFLSELIILWAAVGGILNGNSAMPVAILVLGVSLFVITVTVIFGGLVRHLALLFATGDERSTPAGPDRDWTVAAGNDQIRHLWPLGLLLGCILVLGVSVPSRPLNLPLFLHRSTCIVEGFQEDHLAQCDAGSNPGGKSAGGRERDAR